LSSKSASKQIALASLIAAIYGIGTPLLGELAYAWIQVRVTDALLPLSYLLGYPAVIGVTIGCIIANLLSPIGLIDLIAGPILNFISALLAMKVNKIWLAPLPPITIVSIGVSTYVSAFYGVPYWLCLASVLAGETISCYVIGLPLLKALEKIKIQELLK